MKVEKLKVSNFEKIGWWCAWAGCSEICEGGLEMGWVNLLTWWSPWPEPELTIGEVACGPFCKRDTVLCPVHAAELESLLREIGGQLRDVQSLA
jgi:hypothetical protein